MRIAVDIQAIQGWSSKGRGIGRYIVDFVDALITRDDLDLTLLTNPRRPMTAEVLEMSERAIVRSIADDGWERDLDWYVISSPFEFDLSIDDLWPPQVRSIARTAAIAYDLIPLRYSEQYLAETQHEIAYRTRLELLSSVDLLMAISESTRNDFREHFGDRPRVTTIGTGVPHAFHGTGGVDTDPRDLIPEIKSGFIMYTGGGDPRKNVSRLIDAYGSLPSDVRDAHQLVLVYRLTDFERTLLHQQCEQLGIGKNVLVTGYVPDETLRILYGATRLFVFPSLYEGFGLPIVEASLNNAPVIASNSSSMTELILDEDLRFDPTQESQIAKAIQTTLARDDLEDIATAQREHISSTFTWQNAAEAAIDSMRRIPARRAVLPSRRVATRPRIAIVGPLPPQRSGIADYTWRLLPDLTIDADVVCVVESDVRSEVPLPPNGVTVLTVQEFERMRRVHPFDETVIVMGNSSFHHYCWDLLNEMPATVLAHELRYTGLFQSYAALRLNNPDFFRNLLAREYGGVDPNLELETFLESDTAADMGIHLVGPIIDRASKFLTTSNWAAQVARLIRPTRATDIETVGFAYPSTDLNTSSYKSTPPVLVSIGVQFPTKRTLDIVRALSIVRESHPDVCLRLVGPIDDWYEADVRELAQELGLGSAVTILGHVPEGQLRREIESASVAVQLRVASNGEVSAAIADCLVAGTPVVTTSIGAQGELADAGVELLDRSAAPLDIATAIVSILEDAPRQEVMAEKGRRWATERNPSFAAHELLSALGLGSGRP